MQLRHAMRAVIPSGSYCSWIRPSTSLRQSTCRLQAVRSVSSSSLSASAAPPRKPLVVMVPGAWHGPWSFEPLRSNLHASGYDTVAISNPSVGIREPPVTSHMEDVHHLRSELEILLEQQRRDILLVAHSYGGIVASGAVEGFVKGELSLREIERHERHERHRRGTRSLPQENRSTANNKPRELGVVGCVFMASTLPRTGESLQNKMRPLPAEFTPLADPKNPVYINISHAPQILYKDMLPDPIVSTWSAQLQPTAVTSFISPFEGAPAWKHVPCTYIACRQDNAVSYETQKQNIELARPDSRFPWRVVELECGHSPMLTQVARTAEIVAEAADGAVVTMDEVVRMQRQKMENKEKEQRQSGKGAGLLGLHGGSPEGGVPAGGWQGV